MNEKQIECFLTVSKYQSFSRAAQALFMTQPTVTHQIAALEAKGVIGSNNGVPADLKKPAK